MKLSTIQFIEGLLNNPSLLNNEEYLSKIPPTTSISLILSKNEKLRTDFLELVKDYPGGTIKEIIYNLKNQNKKDTKCICGVNLPFVNGRYQKYCSFKCRDSDPLLKLQKEKTNLEKYGSKIPTQSKEVKDKIKQTNLEKYGYAYHIHTSNSKIKAASKRKEYHDKNILKRGRLPFKSNNDYESLLLSNNLFVESKEDFINQVKDFLDSKEIDYIYDMQIDYRQCDIICEERNLIIQCNLLQDLSLKNSILSEYTNYFENKGYKVIHLTDYDWKFKNEIVKNRLCSILGLNKTIYARHTEIRLVNKDDMQTFVMKHHLQGFAKAKINIGLYYNDELVALMNFDVPRYNKNYNYELIRYVSKDVVGGASKLLKYFMDNYMKDGESILSYADRKWSSGGLYKSLGFEQKKKTSGRLWYYKNNLLVHSSLAMSNIHLEKRLEKFDPSKTPMENMLNNSWKYFYDCGTLVFSKTK